MFRNVSVFVGVFLSISFGLYAAEREEARAHFLGKPLALSSVVSLGSSFSNTEESSARFTVRGLHVSTPRFATSKEGRGAGLPFKASPADDFGKHGHEESPSVVAAVGVAAPRDVRGSKGASLLIPTEEDRDDGFPYERGPDDGYGKHGDEEKSRSAAGYMPLPWVLSGSLLMPTEENASSAAGENLLGFASNKIEGDTAAGAPIARMPKPTSVEKAKERRERRSKKLMWMPVEEDGSSAAAGTKASKPMSRSVEKAKQRRIKMDGPPKALTEGDQRLTAPTGINAHKINAWFVHLHTLYLLYLEECKIMEPGKDRVFKVKEPSTADPSVLEAFNGAIKMLRTKGFIVDY